MKYFLALLRNFEFSDSKIQNLLKIKIPGKCINKLQKKKKLYIIYIK